MPWSPSKLVWPPEKIGRLSKYLHDGMSFEEIAAALGHSKNAIAGIVYRLRVAGHPAIPAMKDRPKALPRRAPRAATAPPDKLAELISDGCPSLFGAALRMHLSIDEVERLWIRICANLGPQAS